MLKDEYKVYEEKMKVHKHGQVFCGIHLKVPLFSL